MRSRRRTAGRRRLAIAGVVFLALIAGAIAIATSGGNSGPPPLPLPGIGQPAKPGDPFAYVPDRESDFVARAIAGGAHVLYVKSPGGALATAARVAAWRGLIDQAVAGTNIDPSILEALVFVESAGRQNVIAGLDPSGASGLTQILAQTGQSLLGMHINLARSRQLTGKIDQAAGQGKLALVARLQSQRAQIDDRFDPRKTLAATVRYLQIAEQHFGRADLAVESYHMGIGNLQNVLNDYDGGKPVPYAQLYFDSAPDHHASAFNLLAGFGDDSSLYYWRLLGAQQIMRLYRTDRAELTRLSALQTATDSQAFVLHPPDAVHPFATPDALDRAYANRTILPLPTNARALGLAYDPGIGSLAAQLKVAPGALPRPARTRARPADRTRRPRAHAVRRRRAADRDERGHRRALPAAARNQRPAGRRRVVVHDRAPLRRSRAGGRVPGDARPSPGAQRDRVAAVPVRDRGHGGVRRLAGPRARTMNCPLSG